MLSVKSNIPSASDSILALSTISSNAVFIVAVSETVLIIQFEELVLPRTLPDAKFQITLMISIEEFAVVSYTIACAVAYARLEP